MPVEITSRKNELVKEVLHLSESASYRKEKRRFVVEGARLCADAAASGVGIFALLCTPKADEKYGRYLSGIRAAAQREYRIPLSVAVHLSGTKTPQGVFCVCGLPNTDRPFSMVEKGRNCLMLENLQDPANMGAILRTAEALGIGGVVFGGSCCDAFSPKVLRASMGAVFRLPFLGAENAADAVRQFNRNGYTTFAAVPDAAAEAVTLISFEKPSVAVIGNEGNGLAPETIAACSRRVTIPMAGRAESLNAAASAAILMWEMTRSNSGGGHV